MFQPLTEVVATLLEAEYQPDPILGYFANRLAARLEDRVDLFRGRVEVWTSSKPQLDDFCEADVELLRAVVQSLDDVVAWLHQSKFRRVAI